MNKLRFAIAVVLCLLLLAPALADKKLVTETSTQGNPAGDTVKTTTVYIGKGLLRKDDGAKSMILRVADKKMYWIDRDAGVAYEADLPFSIMNYMPEAQRAALAQMGAAGSLTVTPTEEVKEIAGLKVKRYNLTMNVMGMVIETSLWTSNELSAYDDLAHELLAILSSLPGMGEGIASELEKISGYPLLTESSMNMMGTTIKNREIVTAISEFTAPAGHYEVAPGMTVKPMSLEALQSMK